MRYSQVFSIRPKSKGRPRMTRRGRAFTPKETVEYERSIANAYVGPMFADGLISMKLRFTKEGTELFMEQVELDPEAPKVKGRLTGDIDNYAKSVLDALNGVAYTDDKQIVCLYLEKA